jgi:hypothetical protein
MKTKVSVKSTDPRKPKIMAALKRRSGANRVTNVVELWTQSGALAGHYFRGHCMKLNPTTGFYDSIGETTIAAAEAGLE